MFMCFKKRVVSFLEEGGVVWVQETEALVPVLRGLR